MVDSVNNNSQVVPSYEPPAVDSASSGPSLAAQRAPVSEGVARMFAAVPAKPAPEETQGERTLVASENSVQAGGVRDAYDMSLYQEADGTYSLDMNMDIEMNFVTGPNGQTWTDAEKTQYMEDFKNTVESSWSGRTFTTDDGQEVKLNVNLNIKEDMTGENWNVDIVKINPGEFNQSYVIPSQNTGVFDSGDVMGVPKGANEPQKAAAHEFGHMIGLPDEYNGRGGPEAQKDTNSIMHTGMELRERHFDIAESWVENQLPAAFVSKVVEETSAQVLLYNS